MDVRPQTTILLHVTLLLVPIAGVHAIVLCLALYAIKEAQKRRKRVVQTLGGDGEKEKNTETEREVREPGKKEMKDTKRKTKRDIY